MYLTGKSGQGYNSFNFERAYLNAMEQLSSRTSVRATLDVFDGDNGSGSNGYEARLKYGYLQYDYLQGTGLNATARLGMLHTVAIDHEEHFWPRWIQKSPTEFAGYFESADLGVATLVTMPSKMGEVYAAVTNGTGYTTGFGDDNRFKDYQARLTLTPFSSGTGILSTFDLSGWYYKGATENTFTTKALAKDRWGVFAGIKDPRLTVGLDWAENKDESATSPTTVGSVTGRLLSAYTTIRPMASGPLGLVLRYDQLKPNTGNDQNYSLLIGGLTYEVSSRASLSADYQEVDGHNGLAAPDVFGNGTAAGPRAFSVHMVVNY